MRVNINTCPCVNISPCLLDTCSSASFLLSLEATEVDKGRWDILLPLNCSKRKCNSPYIYPSLMTLLRQYNDLFPLEGTQSSCTLSLNAKRILGAQLHFQLTWQMAVSQTMAFSTQFIIECLPANEYIFKGRP